MMHPSEERRLRGLKAETWNLVFVFLDRQEDISPGEAAVAATAAAEALEGAYRADKATIEEEGTP